jgi:hypothetical protein
MTASSCWLCIVAQLVLRPSLSYTSLSLLRIVGAAALFKYYYCGTRLSWTAVVLLQQPKTGSGAVVEQQDASVRKLLMQVNNKLNDAKIVAYRASHSQWGSACSSLQKKRQVLAPACWHSQGTYAEQRRAFLACSKNACLPRAVGLSSSRHGVSSQMSPYSG